MSIVTAKIIDSPKLVQLVRTAKTKLCITLNASEYFPLNAKVYVLFFEALFAFED